MLWWDVIQLKSRNWRTVSGSLRRLGEARHARAVKPIIQVLKRTRGTLQDEAKKALVKIGVPALDLLLLAFQEHGASARSAVADALGEIGDPRSVDHLICALSDSDRFVRRQSASALGHIGDSRAVKPLSQLLNDPLDDVRTSAVWSIGRIGGKEAFEPLLIALSDTDRDVRRLAIEGLRVMSDTRAVSAIAPRLGDNDSWVARVACAAIHEMGTSTQIAALVDLAGSEAHVVAPALQKLLERDARNAHAGDLRVLAELPNVIWKLAGANCDASFDSPIDFSLVKQLARQELLRRGEHV